MEVGVVGMEERSRVSLAVGHLVVEMSDVRGRGDGVVETGVLGDQCASSLNYKICAREVVPAQPRPAEPQPC